MRIQKKHDDLPKCNELQLAESHVDAFYNDDDFMYSKRFQRFMSAAEEQVGEYLVRLWHIPNDKVAAKNLLMQELRYTFLLDMKENLCRTELHKKWFAENIGGFPPTNRALSTYGLVSCMRTRAFDLLSAVFSPLGNKISRAWKNYIDTYISMLFSDEMCNQIYQSALRQTCYDYILTNTITHKLNNSTWMTQLKTMDARECLSFYLHIYDTFAKLVENNVAMALWVKKNPARQVRTENLRLVCEINEIQRVANALGQKVEVRDEELVKLRKQNGELRTMLETAAANTRETSRLERDLRKKKTECEEWKEKCERLEKLNEELRSSILEDPEDNEVPSAPTLTLETIMQDELCRTARPVFVRDIEAKNYVMMQRLAEIFPRAKFTNGVASDINTRTTDLIVALISYTSHPVYYNGINLAKRQNIPYIAVKYANVERISMEVLKNLRKILNET